MDKSRQKYSSQAKLRAAGQEDYDEIMKWKENPMNGVKNEEACQVFGQWDFAILFQADTNDNALHFVGDIVRPLEGVAEMKTTHISHR